MPHHISRREFNQVAAAMPLIGFPLAGSNVSGKRSQARLQVQYHRICVDGWHLDGDDWRLAFFVGVVQRKQSDPRYWRGRVMVPTDEFIQGLRHHSIQVEPHQNPKWLVADRASLPNGVAGLGCLLEAASPTAQQYEFFSDPAPERWGEYTIRCHRVVKRFWVGTDGGSSS